MKAREIAVWVAIAVAVLGIIGTAVSAGSAYGALKQRMDDEDQFYHGGYQAPHFTPAPEGAK